MHLLPSPPVLPTLSTTYYGCHNNSEGLPTCKKNTTQIIEQPAQSSTCPTDFHIGCRVTVTSSHPVHTGKAGTVCRHTKKYVMFTPNEHPTDIIRILPKSLAAYHPDGRRMINSSDGNEEHDPGQTEREHDMYDQLDETKNFSVADGFVSFTRTFKYLVSHIIKST